MDAKKKLKIALILNIIIVVLEIGALLWMGIASVVENRPSPFNFYTFDSNVVLLIVSSFSIYFIIKAMKNNQTILPKKANYIKLAGVGCTTLTFLMVVCYLWIPAGWAAMAGKYNFFLHLICPPLGIVSYIFFEQYEDINKFKAMIPSLIMTLIYGITMIVLILFDVGYVAYPFLNIKVNPVYVTIISSIGIALAISLMGFLLRLFNVMANKDKIMPIDEK